MEHIQTRAKEQLLSIDDNIFQQQNDQFFILFTQSKHKKKKNFTAKNSACNSFHQKEINVEKQNSKQTLKKNLRELLQTQIISPKTSLHRVTTLSSIRTTKHSKTSSKMPNLYYNEKTARVSDFQKLPLFSLLRENQSCMNKRINPIDSKELSKKNLFDQQNLQIRKLIKKKIQQKASQKQLRILPLANTIENVKKFKTLIYQKIKNQQNIQQNSSIRQKNNNKKSSTKLLKERISEKAKIYDKQNLNGISQTSSMIRQKENCFQSRKLKNLLF